jgi:Domain of unknown function (DUF4331)
MQRRGPLDAELRSALQGGRLEFFVDLGSIFDLGDIRPLQHLHLVPTPDAPGVDATRGLNVHSIAIQIPKSMLTKDGSIPSDVTSPTSVIGVWTTASRRKASVRNDAPGGADMQSGPWVQISRLGNPLINEVVVPMSMKDYWNTTAPSEDSQFAAAGLRPELAKLLPVLYPGVFPNLDALNKNTASSADRSDLAAVLFTGIPTGVVPGFQNNTGSTIADMLRLNMAVPPSQNPNALGILGGDLAGFPNGRRVLDDVVTIELRAVAGATYALVNPSYKPDDAVSLVTGGVTASDNPVSPLGTFPYLGEPIGGFQEIPASAA